MCIDVQPKIYFYQTAHKEDNVLQGVRFLCDLSSKRLDRIWRYYEVSLDSSIFIECSLHFAVALFVFLFIIILKYLNAQQIRIAYPI